MLQRDLQDGKLLDINMCYICKLLLAWNHHGCWNVAESAGWRIARYLCIIYVIIIVDMESSWICRVCRTESYYQQPAAWTLSLTMKLPEWHRYACSTPSKSPVYSITLFSFFKFCLRRDVCVLFIHLRFSHPSLSFSSHLFSTPMALYSTPWPAVCIQICSHLFFIYSCIHKHCACYLHFRFRGMGLTLSMKQLSMNLNYFTFVVLRVCFGTFWEWMGAVGREFQIN